MAEVQQTLIVKPAFQIGPGIDPRRGVALEVDKVARLVSVGGVKEMMVAHLEQGRVRGISREVTADAGILLVLAMHHGHGIPANKAFQPLFELAIARVGYFVMFGNGVPVGGCQCRGGRDARLARSLPQRRDQLRALLGAFAHNQVVERLNPLGYLFRKLRLGGNSEFRFHNYLVVGPGRNRSVYPAPQPIGIAQPPANPFAKAGLESASLLIWPWGASGH